MAPGHYCVQYNGPRSLLCPIEWPQVTTVSNRMASGHYCSPIEWPQVTTVSKKWPQVTTVPSLSSDHVTRRDIPQEYCSEWSMSQAQKTPEEIHTLTL